MKRFTTWIRGGSLRITTRVSKLWGIQVKREEDSHSKKYTPNILHVVDIDSSLRVEEGRSIVLGESVLELGVPHPLQSSRCHCFVGDELR
jgi:hypothetical protein